MKYSDFQRLEKILILLNKLLNYIRTNMINREDIILSETVQWTITTPLYNIGEHAYMLSKPFKEKYDHIPWSKISGLRHRLVHDYEDTNWEIICDVIYDVLPKFEIETKALLDKIRKEESNI